MRYVTRIASRTVENVSWVISAIGRTRPGAKPHLLRMRTAEVISMFFTNRMWSVNIPSYKDPIALTMAQVVCTCSCRGSGE